MRRVVGRFPDDLDSLARLAGVEEDRGRWQSAIRLRRRLADRTGDPADRERLADLLADADERDAAAEAYRAAFLAGDRAGRLALLDRLLTDGRFGIAFELSEEELADRPDDWEVLYRRAVAAAWAADERAAAVEALRAVWAAGPPPGRAAGHRGRVDFASSAARRMGFLDRIRGGPRRGAGPPPSSGHAKLAAAVLLGRADPAFAARLLAAGGLETAGPHAAEPAASPGFAAVLHAAEFLAAVVDHDELRDLFGRPRRESYGEAVRRLAGIDRSAAAPVVVLYFERRGVGLRDGGGPAPDPLSPADLDLLAAAADDLRAAGDPAAGDAFRSLFAELKLAGAADRLEARVAGELAAAADPRRLKDLTETFAGLRLPAAATAAMQKAADLPPAGRAAATPEYFKLAPVLIDATTAGDWDAAFAVADAHAALTRPSPADRAGARKRGGRMVDAVVPRRGDAGAVSYSSEAVSFPPPAAPVAADQVALLRSLWLVLWLDPEWGGPDFDGPARLREHLRRRAAAATGPAAAAEFARLASVRAWAGDRDAAWDALRSARAADPDDDPLARTLAWEDSGAGDAAD